MREWDRKLGAVFKGGRRAGSEMQGWWLGRLEGRIKEEKRWMEDRQQGVVAEDE